MNMLTRHRTPGRFNLELSAPPFEELMRSMFNYFPGLRSDLVFGSEINSRLEVVTGDKNVEVKFPCPGRCKDDFTVEVVGDFLTVKAVKCCKENENDSKKRYVIRERVCETYEESVKLPVPVKGAETTAKYTHGVLEITIPRLEKDKDASHTVKVN